jgi:hypothetical protein
VGSANPREPPAPDDPNELAVPNGQTRVGFMKPGENCTPSTLKHRRKPACRRNRTGAQQVERGLAQPELPPAGGEDTVCVRDGPRGTDGVARRHLEITRVDALRIQMLVG